MTSHQYLSRLCAESYTKSNFEEADIEVIAERSLEGGGVFAFRGTDEVSDIARDLRVLPWWTPGIGWVPRGFLLAGKRLALKCVSHCLEKGYDTSRIELTGHSLGGAVALIVGSLLKRDEISPRQIVTFGAPRCGRLKVLDDVHVTCYRNGKDIVPLLPPIFRRHCKLLQHGERNGFVKDHYAKNYVRMPK